MTGRLRELRRQLNGWTDPDIPVAAEFAYSGGQAEFTFYNLVFLATLTGEARFIGGVVESAIHRWDWVNLVVIGLAVMWTGLTIFIWFPMRRLWRWQRRVWAVRSDQIHALDADLRVPLLRSRRTFLLALAAVAGLATLCCLLYEQPQSPLNEAIRRADTGLFHLSYLRSCGDPASSAVATAEGPIIPAAGSWDLNRAIDNMLRGSSLLATPTFSIRAGTSPGMSVRCIQLTSLDKPPLIVTYPVRPTTTNDPNSSSQKIVAFTGAPTLSSRDNVRWDVIAWHQTGAPSSRFRTTVSHGRQIASYAAGALAVAMLGLAIVAGRRYLRRRPVVRNMGRVLEARHGL